MGRTRNGHWGLPVVSVRTRLLAVIAAAVAVGLVGVGAAVYISERARILATTDDLLMNNLESAQVLVQTYVDEEPNATAADALRVVVQRVSPDDNMGVLGIIDGEATLVPGVQLDLQLESQPDFVDHVVAEANGTDAMLGRYAENDVTWQYLAAPIVLSEGQQQDVLFVMAYDLEAELAEINGSGRTYIVASAIAMLLVLIVGGIAAGRLLRPLRRMRETAQRVSGQQMNERIPVEGRDDVSELARTMNDMLDRLDASLDDQRQLLSDVRHELRTPITIVRGHLELMNPDDPGDVRETQELAVDELDRMNALVQDLSESAAVHGPASLELRATDIRELVAVLVRKAEAIAGATVEAGPAIASVIPIDQARITQAVLQLAQNGVTHGGGRLVIGCRAAGENLELWVRDFGPGVPDDLKKRIFERFDRGAGGTRGSGLGLGIVQMIAAAHGGSARVIDPHDGPGAVFVLTLPMRGPSYPAPGTAAGAPAAPPMPGAQAGMATAPTPPLPPEAHEVPRREPRQTNEHEEEPWHRF